LVIIFGAIILIISWVNDIDAQILSSSRLGWGVNFGGQRIYCDKPKTGFGFGIEGYGKYAISPRFFVIGSFGYGELSDGTFVFDKCTFSTDVVNFDLKGAYNLVTEGRVIPYAYLGLGGIWFHLDSDLTPGFDGHYFNGYFDASFLLGGGIEVRLNPKIALNSYMDYRFTTGDDLDGGYNSQWSQSRDGYLNVRTGVTYYAEPGRFGTGREIQVSERTPIEELNAADTTGLGKSAADQDELSALIEGIDQYEEKSAGDFAMNEYIQLKSRVEELNDAINRKELEIEELKSQLQYRKERIAELEQNLKRKSGALAASLNADLTDFSKSYEQALQHFYAREFDAAIYIFNMLLETSPTHKLASNCQYWIGECYFGKQDYASAVEAFEKVLAYENSHKKDDALLMLGRSYIKLGDKQLAAQMFNQLMNDYPDSEYFEKAQRYANSIL